MVQRFERGTAPGATRGGRRSRCLRPSPAASCAQPGARLRRSGPASPSHGRPRGSPRAPARRAGERAPAGRLGLRRSAGSPRGRRRTGPARTGAAGRRRSTRAARAPARCAQVRRVAAVEVEQVRPLQRERVARVLAAAAPPRRGRRRASRRRAGFAARPRWARSRWVACERARFGDRRAARASASSAGSVRLSRKPAFISCGSVHAGSAAAPRRVARAACRRTTSCATARVSAVRQRAAPEVRA